MVPLRSSPSSKPYLSVLAHGALGSPAGIWEVAYGHHSAYNSSTLQHSRELAHGQNGVQGMQQASPESIGG